MRGVMLGTRPLWPNALLGGLVALTLLATPSSAAEDRVIESEAGKLQVQTMAEGLAHPWGMAFLPDGDLLVTERPGRLRRLAKDGTLSEPLKGVPKVFAKGQGGLLDVALDPDFAANRLVYISYAEPGDGGAGTAVARGRLGDAGLEDVEIIFRQEPKVDGDSSFRRPAGLRPRRQAVRHAWRALQIHAGARPRKRSRQDRAHQSRRLGAQGQPVRRTEGRAARDLVLWPPQSCKGPRSTPRPADCG